MIPSFAVGRTQEMLYFIRQIKADGLVYGLKETTQMGVERIGDESADADAELLAMTVECLLAAGLTEFQVSVGQVDYFKSLLKEAELGPEAEERLRVLISQKNSFGVEEFVEEQKLKDSMQKAGDEAKFYNCCRNQQFSAGND